MSIKKRDAASLSADKNIKYLCDFSEKILIVDDEKLHLHSLRELMNQNGHEVETANNGNQAIEKLKTNKN